jgi:hypothetical protein
MDDRLIPVLGVLLFVAMAFLVGLVVKYTKPRREIGVDDVFQPDPLRLQPRKTLPTEDDILEPKVPVLGSSVALCRACGEPLTSNAVTLEAWERTHRFWDRIEDGWARQILQVFGVVGPRDHARELYEAQGYCHSCAGIAPSLDRGHRETQAVRRLAEDRLWERDGLPEAVREAVAEEQERLKRARRKWGRPE